jgi:AcrR family transcriptional regulator
MSSNPKQRHALDAATDVFCRYGFHRTTMGDIARQAGMSRPALYLLFPDKDAVFTAVVRQMDEAKRAEIRDEIASAAGLHVKLLRACLAWGCHGVDLAAVHPDAADLFDLAFPVVHEVYRNFQALVAELIAEQVRQSGLEARPEELARTLVFGLRGLRATAADGTEMRCLITVLVEVFMRAIEPGG